MASLQSLNAWFYNSNGEDERSDHKYSPNREVSREIMEGLGIVSWKVANVENYKNNGDLQKILMDRGYHYKEVATLAPGKIEDYDAKIKCFFTEHLHPYDESRLILEGCGYWDIRDHLGQWIRFHVTKGDMIVLPPGMYHRFTLDKNNYIKALLLYIECPTRVDILKPNGDDLPIRKDYVKSIMMTFSKISTTSWGTRIKNVLLKTFSLTQNGSWI